MTKLRLVTALSLGLLLALSGCAPSQPATPATTGATAQPAASAAGDPPAVYRDAAAPVDARVDDLLGRMSLAEKIGQTTLIEKNSLTPADVTNYLIGGVLSGGGGAPPSNTPEAWRTMVTDYQAAALATPLGIPLIYGVDAVHGHNNVRGATIFPHNIGLGATRNPALVEAIGRATAAEVAATGIDWNYAPAVSVPQDIRWGRTYEGFSEDPTVVSALSAAYLRGLQASGLVFGTPKHFIADGGTAWQSSTTENYLIDQGDARIDEATLRAVHLPPYAATIAEGARVIMVSYSSWNGVKLHDHAELISGLLKGELAFDGFVVSDWGAIDQIEPDYYGAVVRAINAGIDMNMVPYDHRRYIDTLTLAVERGDVPLARIDDAVRRILTVKFELGLFDRPAAGDDLAVIGSADHRTLARQAVRESLVLLQNANQTLPLDKATPVIFVSGEAADDIGLQAGGWTISWQGSAGAITPGSSVLDGIEALATGELYFNRFGRFERITDDAGNPRVADVAIVVLAEAPYAEGRGDSDALGLTETEVALLERAAAHSERLVVVLLSGRPRIITPQLPLADAWVAAWLPGSEGAAVADVLFGDHAFGGQLPFSWPRSIDQLPFDRSALAATGCAAPLYPFGYGLRTDGSTPVAAAECP